MNTKTLLSTVFYFFLLIQITATAQTNPKPKSSWFDSTINTTLSFFGSGVEAVYNTLNGETVVEKGTEVLGKTTVIIDEQLGGPDLTEFEKALKNIQENKDNCFDQKIHYFKSIKKHYGYNTPKLVDGLEENLTILGTQKEDLWAQLKNSEEEVSILSRTVAQLSPHPYLPYIKVTAHTSAIIGCAYAGYKISSWLNQKLWGQEYKTTADIIKKINQLTLLCEEYQTTIAQRHVELEIAAINSQKKEHKIALKTNINKLETVLKEVEQNISNLNDRLSNPATIGHENNIKKCGQITTTLAALAGAAYCGHLLYTVFENNYLPAATNVTDEEQLKEKKHNLLEQKNNLSDIKKQYTATRDMYNGLETISNNPDIRDISKEFKKINLNLKRIETEKTELLQKIKNVEKTQKMQIFAHLLSNSTNN